MDSLSTELEDKLAAFATQTLEVARISGRVWYRNRHIASLINAHTPAISVIEDGYVRQPETELSAHERIALRHARQARDAAGTALIDRLRAVPLLSDLGENIALLLGTQKQQLSVKDIAYSGSISLAPIVARGLTTRNFAKRLAQIVRTLEPHDCPPPDSWRSWGFGTTRIAAPTPELAVLKYAAITAPNLAGPTEIHLPEMSELMPKDHVRRLFADTRLC